MLDYMQPLESLTALARYRKRSFDVKTVKSSAVPQELEAGWVVKRENKASAQLSRRKPASIELRD